MSKKGLEIFLEKARGDFRLADEFAKAVADIARREGYDVQDYDVIEQFLDKPAADKNPGGRMTTMAMGEEGSPRVRPLPPEDGPQATTMAMGEETNGRMRPLPGPNGTDDITSLAIGEEDRHGRASVTLAIGEEDHPRQRPLPQDDLDVVTTAAVGEEGPIKGPQSSAMGEEGNIPAPKEPVISPAPDAPSVTLAIGEEDRPRQRPLPQDGEPRGATTMAMGEEGNPPAPAQDGASVTMAMGEEERKQPPRFTITSHSLGEEEKPKAPPAGGATTMAMGEETRKPPQPPKR